MCGVCAAWRIYFIEMRDGVQCAACWRCVRQAARQLRIIIGQLTCAQCNIIYKRTNKTGAPTIIASKLLNYIYASLWYTIQTMKLKMANANAWYFFCYFCLLNSRPVRCIQRSKWRFAIDFYMCMCVFIAIHQFDSNQYIPRGHTN